jgi:tRNA-Thr(GGU) m(6)t(6)A37 methyltransferase TsaA
MRRWLNSDRAGDVTFAGFRSSHCHDGTRVESTCPIHQPVAEVNTSRYEVTPVGWVHSPLVDLAHAPRQGDEGAPQAWLIFEPHVAEAIRDLRVGDHIIVLSWLDRAKRDVLSTHPRDDLDRPLVGVFSTRSPDRPNPIGLHRVQILVTDGLRILVSHLEALDGTPILDVKPVLDPIAER